MLQRAIILSFLLIPAFVSARPIVVELYTSQGCASCPPADALLGQMVGRQDLLPLSFHVDYWDHLGYKDEFAIPQSQRRQKVYNVRFEIDSLFTPQVVVDGLATAIGSHKNAIEKIISSANASLDEIPIEVHLDKEKNEMTIKVSGVDDGVDVERFPNYLDVWLVTFVKGFSTPVDAGENVGKDLPSYNIVRRLVLLGKWNQRTNFYTFPLDNFAEDAMAILVQQEEGGRIFGSNVFYQR